MQPSNLPPPLPQAARLPEPGALGRLGFIVVMAMLLTALADFLFWKHTPGVSLAIYCCAVAWISIAIRRESSGRAPWIAAGLMLASSYATATEISFTNITVLVALLAVVCGECWYAELPACWPRWSESLAAWLAAPGRWPWLIGQMETGALVVFGAESRLLSRSARAVRIAAPAVFLLVIFSLVLGSGNAVYGDLLSRAWSSFTQFIENLDLSVPHLLFWLLFGTLALAFLRPHAAPPGLRKWARKVPLFARGDAGVAAWQSGLVLMVLNILFFTINTIDVFYLWRNAELPKGVTYSAYVHEGVASLIVAVLLSALVIAAIFQQQGAVRRGRLLKAGALLWIAQNLVLIAGVFQRLRLYVIAYELSEERVYVGCFLLLVIAGFLLLAWHVAREGDMNALIFRNALAIFALFFVLQFTNVAGWVARYNVTRWKQEPQRELDVPYLASLGPGAWPSLVDVASSNHPGGAATQARGALRLLAENENLRLQSPDWRSWQGRRDSQSRWLVAQSAKLPPP